MSNYDLAVIEQENPSPRCPVALLLDTSASMDGEPIEQLNEGIEVFFNAVGSDDFARFAVELEIITFGGETKRYAPFISFNDLTEVRYPNFTAGGMTPMGAALDMAFDDLKQRKNQYKRDGVPYYQPWIVLMTDGAPNDNWQAAAEKARKMDGDRKLVFIGVGIGEDADMDVLTGICPISRPPKKLRELKFSEFFVWLSQSLSAVSQSSVGDRVPLPPTDGWDAI